MYDEDDDDDAFHKIGLGDTAMVAMAASKMAAASFRGAFRL